MLQGHRLPAGAVRDMKGLVESPQFLARDLLQKVWNPEIGEVQHLRGPWRFSETPADVTRSAPLFGEHNDYVYRELLGLSDEEIAHLTEQKVIATAPTG